MDQNQDNTLKIDGRGQSLWLCLNCSETYQGGLSGEISGAGQNCPADGGTLMLLPAIDAPLVGNYLYKGLLGVGGMGVVLKALNPYLDKMVAIKNVKGKKYDEKQMQRFKQEGKLLSKLVHPNLVSVLDFGANELAEPYMVMEYLDGQSLASLIAKSGTIALPLALEILIQTCEGLAHAHKFGAVHRDIKPTNIFILNAQGAPTVKLLDFGIAKLCFPEDPTGAADLTRTGEIFGSPLYMSPEQALGKTVDERSDLYSLGCVLYEMLCGRPPIVGKTAMETIFKHVSETPQPLSKANPKKQYPPSVQALLTCLLAKDPSDRIESAEKLAVLLSSIDSGTATDLRALHEKARILTERALQDERVKPSTSGSTKHSTMAWKVSTFITAMALLSLSFFVFLHRAEAPATVVESVSKENLKPAPPAKVQTIEDTLSDALLPEDVQRSFLARELEKLTDTVDLTNIDLTDADFQLLARRGQKLNFLAFNKDAGLTARRLEMLQKLPLCKLKLADSDLDDAGLLAITKIKTVRFLTIINCAVLSPGSWIALKQMPELNFLQIESCLIDPVAFRESFPMRHLDTLTLEGSRRAAAPLSQRIFRVNDTLPQIGQCTELKNIDLTASDVNAKGLQSLVGLNKLVKLSLGSCPRVDDSVVAVLIKMHGLGQVRLTDTKVGPEALENLLKNSKIQSVVISNRNKRLSPYLERQISVRRLAF